MTKKNNTMSFKHDNPEVPGNVDNFSTDENEQERQMAEVDRNQGEMNRMSQQLNRLDARMND